MQNAGLTLTKHFEERWPERVGGSAPDAGQIMQMLRESILLQDPKELFTPRGRRCRVLAMYWHPRKNVVIKVDGKHGRVVTVLSAKMKRRKAYESA